MTIRGKQLSAVLTDLDTNTKNNKNITAVHDMIHQADTNQIASGSGYTDAQIDSFIETLQTAAEDDYLTEADITSANNAIDNLITAINNTRDTRAAFQAKLDNIDTISGGGSTRLTLLADGPLDSSRWTSYQSIYLHQGLVMTGWDEFMLVLQTSTGFISTIIPNSVFEDNSISIGGAAYLHLFLYRHHPFSDRVEELRMLRAEEGTTSWDEYVSFKFGAFGDFSDAARIQINSGSGILDDFVELDLHAYLYGKKY